MTTLTGDRPMGMSTSIVIAKDETEKHKQYREVYRACEEAGIDPPSEILSYFDDMGLEEVENMVGAEHKSLNIDTLKIDDADCTDTYSVDMEELVKKGWKYITFSNGW